MNSTITDFTRTEIKSGLHQLNADHQLLFKRMYSHQDLEISIDKVVDNIPDEKLDWALTQVERTLKKIKESNNEI